LLLFGVYNTLVTQLGADRLSRTDEGRALASY
jgi:hypothetical protein